jgi:catechol 2,3-dioxygenase-like lactoylglutathione lyase family enzyme
MISGAHVILYSRHAEADRGFFRDVLGWAHVDVGHGWLIFQLPPSEVAVHPTGDSPSHELYLTCDDVRATIHELKEKGVTCSPLHEERWGSITRVTLPSGATIGLYQPRHVLAHEVAPR